MITLLAAGRVLMHPFHRRRVGLRQTEQSHPGSRAPARASASAIGQRRGGSGLHRATRFDGSRSWLHRRPPSSVGGLGWDRPVLDAGQAFVAGYRYLGSGVQGGRVKINVRPLSIGGFFSFFEFTSSRYRNRTPTMHTEVDVEYRNKENDGKLTKLKMRRKRQERGYFITRYVRMRRFNPWFSAPALCRLRP